VQIM